MITTPFSRIWLAVIGLALVGVIGLLVARPFEGPSHGPCPSPQPGNSTTVSVSPGLAQQGGRVSFLARGFRPGETVAFRVGKGSSVSANLDLARARADNDGTV